MQNRHRDAQQAFPFNLNAISILGFCRAIDSAGPPAAEVDMFSRWIRLSDDLLAADWKPRKKASKRSRRSFAMALSANPA